MFLRLLESCCNKITLCCQCWQRHWTGSKVLPTAQWGMCYQEVTFVDATFCFSGPLFLTDELVFKGSMLPVAFCSNVSFKIDVECNLQLEIMYCLLLNHSASILVDFPLNQPH